MNANGSTSFVIDGPGTYIVKVHSANRVGIGKAAYIHDVQVLATSESGISSSPESATQSSPESATQSSPESATQSSPESATLSSPESATLSSPESATQSSPESATQSSPESATQGSPESATLSSPESGTTVSPESAKKPGAGDAVVIGGVVGSILFLALTVIVFTFWRNFSRKRREQSVQVLSPFG